MQTNSNLCSFINLMKATILSPTYKAKLYLFDCCFVLSMADLFCAAAGADRRLSTTVRIHLSDSKNIARRNSTKQVKNITQNNPLKLTHCKRKFFGIDLCWKTIEIIIVVHPSNMDL